MNTVLFAAIADDDTGASDLAGMLAGQDVKTVLVLDLPRPDQLAEWCAGAGAVVLAEGTRAIDPGLAYERTRAAIRLVRPLNPGLFQIKYCSTFDSTERGNIGPTIDAAMDELEVDFTIAFPALPVNGRTTYMGYHFVHQQLLSDSPMRNHPLTPMTNPNLANFLGRQTRRKVGLVSFRDVDAGAGAIRQRFAELRATGTQIAVVDCLADRHVAAICEAAADLRLISGGSGPGIGLPPVWRSRGLLGEPRREPEEASAERSRLGCLIVAGSCSEATRSQNDWIAEQGVMVLRLNAREIAAGEFQRQPVLDRAIDELRRGRPCLIATSASPGEVKEVQEWGRREGLSADEVGLRVARELAELARAIVEEQAVSGLISAGGETSGALCRRLEFGAFRVGKNIEPGVPLCHSLGRFRLPVVLKSGNFGSRNFYGLAIQAIG